MAVVRIGGFASSTEAELARGMLDAHGLTTHVSDASDTVYGGRSMLGGGPMLLVDEQDVDEARRLLGQVAHADHAAPPEPDPHQSPFTSDTRTARGTRARRVIVAAIVAYGVVRAFEWAVSGA